MKLRPHQERVCYDARKILDVHGVVLLALEPRVGKTLCALTLASEIEGRCLFVTKKAAMSSIVADSEAMGKLYGRLDVINYESLHKVKFGGYSAVVIDECHRLSAPKKPCKAARQIRGICAGASRVVLLSGTPAIETSAQWFNIFWATARGPWVRFGSGIMAFYSWFKAGGYGIPSPIRIAGGIEVESYKRVILRVADEVKPYAICMTQSDIGFKQSAKVIEHLVNDPLAVEIGARIKKEGIVHIGFQTVLAENPAAILQKQAMICGGSVLDEDGNVALTGSTAKMDYLVSRLTKGKQYAIFTQYIAERDMLMVFLSSHGFAVTDDMEAFKAGEFMVFVGSIKRYSEGVDLSFIDGSMVLYSLTFSGSTYVQILERMNNMNRTAPIKIHVLMVKDSIEPSIFKAVSQKKNFNEAFLNA